MKKIMILMTLCTTLSASELNKNITLDSTASFYHSKFVGRKTANGEVYQEDKLTAANNILPLGTKVKITRIIQEETLSVEVKINDRMHPRFSHRIDLSRKAAQKLKISGIAPVTIQVL